VSGTGACGRPGSAALITVHPECDVDIK
jgi:hypothetical protein